MEHDQRQEPPEARLTEVLKKAARARRMAREFSYDPVAGQMKEYAAELMIEAEVIEADIQAANGKA